MDNHPTVNMYGDFASEQQVQQQQQAAAVAAGGVSSLPPQAQQPLLAMIHYLQSVPDPREALRHSAGSFCMALGIPVNQESESVQVLEFLLQQMLGGVSIYDALLGSPPSLPLHQPMHQQQQQRLTSTPDPSTPPMVVERGGAFPTDPSVSSSPYFRNHNQPLMGIPTTTPTQSCPTNSPPYTSHIHNSQDIAETPDPIDACSPTSPTHARVRQSSMLSPSSSDSPPTNTDPRPVDKPPRGSRKAGGSASPYDSLSIMQSGLNAKVGGGISKDTGSASLLKSELSDDHPICLPSDSSSSRRRETAYCKKEDGDDVTKSCSKTQAQLPTPAKADLIRSLSGCCSYIGELYSEVLLKANDRAVSYEEQLIKLKAKSLEYLSMCPTPVFLYLNSIIVNSLTSLFSATDTPGTPAPFNDKMMMVNNGTPRNIGSLGSYTPGTPTCNGNSNNGRNSLPPMLEDLKKILFCNLAESVMGGAGAADTIATASKGEEGSGQRDTDQDTDSTELPPPSKKAKVENDNGVSCDQDNTSSISSNSSDFGEDEGPTVPPSSIHPSQLQLPTPQPQTTQLPTLQLPTSSVVGNKSSSGCPDYAIGESLLGTKKLSYLIPLLAGLCSQDPSLVSTLIEMMDTQCDEGREAGRVAKPAESKSNESNKMGHNGNSTSNQDLYSDSDNNCSNSSLNTINGNTATKIDVAAASEKDEELLRMPNHIITKGGVVLPPSESLLYLSKVVGVVWDKIHNSWVVNYTLLGRRYFQHFPAKKYGFLEGRRLAIDLRLAKDREKALIEGSVRGGGRRAQGPSWEGSNPPRRRRRRKRLGENHGHNTSDLENNDITDRGAGANSEGICHYDSQNKSNTENNVSTAVTNEATGRSENKGSGVLAPDPCDKGGSIVETSSIEGPAPIETIMEHPHIIKAKTQTVDPLIVETIGSKM